MKYYVTFWLICLSAAIAVVARLWQVYYYPWLTESEVLLQFWPVWSVCLALLAASWFVARR